MQMGFTTGIDADTPRSRNLQQPAQLNDCLF